MGVTLFRLNSILHHSCHPYGTLNKIVQYHFESLKNSYIFILVQYTKFQISYTFFYSVQYT